MTAALVLAGCVVVGGSLAAITVCNELNNGAHWWCLLCALLRLLARRIR